MKNDPSLFWAEGLFFFVKKSKLSKGLMKIIALKL